MTTRSPRTSGVRGRLSRWRMGAAIVAVLSTAAVGVVAAPAYGTSYPSWQDVQDAKASQSAAAKQVTTIENLIKQLQTEVDQANALAKKRGQELFDAQMKLNEATRRAEDLQKQADASQKTADAATTEAGRLAAQLYQAGGSNLTINLLLNASDDKGKADKLLSQLGSMSKLVQRSSEIYDRAAAAQNTAQSLSEQAKVAKGEREKLKVAADKALKAAVAAQEAAKAKLEEQQTHIVELNAQLAALKDKTAKTVKGYQAGVAERRRLAIAAAKAKKLREARAAAAAAAAASAAAPAAPSGGGYIGYQGWAVPVQGWISDGFGTRSSPCPGCTSYHEGADLATSCHTPIHAAHGGTVEYAGWYGGYGNFVLINNGGGIETAYGHIWTGQTYVVSGQRVVAGETIARVGSTGHSTGCHLHFEVRRNGYPINPITFMRQHGAALG